jgi:DNA-binding GntR family transcriptional regulator
MARAPAFRAVDPVNYAERAADGIVDAIAQGALRPSQRLIEADIATELGISRLPVREAFKILAAQGILELNMHRGARVCPIGADRIETVRAARTQIEDLAFRKAAAAFRANPAGLRALDDIIERMKRAEEHAEFDELNRLDIAFHREVVVAASDPFLVALWEALALHLRIVFAWEVKGLPRPISYAAVHLALRYALARDDDAALSALLGRHIAGKSEIDPAPAKTRETKNRRRKP